MTTYAYVYAITHAESGNSYIGCTTQKSVRFMRHRTLLRHGKHHSYRLQSLWDEDGEEAFVFEVIERIPNSTKETRVARELFWIELRGTLNTHVASGGGFTLRPEDAMERKRITLAKIASDPELKDFLTERGKQIAALARSPEARASMSAHTKRRWKNPKEAERLSSGLKRRWEDPEEHRKASERITAPEYAEARKKRAQSLKERWADPKRNQTLMESRKKRWADPEAKEKQSQKLREAWERRKAQQS